MAALLLALAVLQDPGEEIRTLLRRLENPSGTAEESAEVLLRLGQAIEQVAPAQARSLVGDALRADRMPSPRRLDLAETLIGLDDRTSWTEEVARIVQDAGESADTRIRAALLLARANAPKAEEIGRSLDERLFAEATDDAARALGTHLREGTSRELQRFEIELLFRLPIPGARAAIREALADDGLDPLLRLEIAERLQAAGGITRVRDVRAAVERVRQADPSLADRAGRLLARLQGLREDPASSLSEETAEPRGHPVRKERPASGSAGRVNLIVGGVTVIVLALLLGVRRKSPLP
jgi:hypothetical protein